MTQRQRLIALRSSFPCEIDPLSARRQTRIISNDFAHSLALLVFIVTGQEIDRAVEMDRKRLIACNPALRLPQMSKTRSQEQHNRLGVPC
jgi:hypothetical protein